MSWGEQLGVPRQVFNDPILVGIEKMGPVFLYKDAVLVVFIVHIPANVGPLFHDLHLAITFLGDFPRQDTAGKAGADDDDPAHRCFSVSL